MSSLSPPRPSSPLQVSRHRQSALTSVAFNSHPYSLGNTYTPFQQPSGTAQLALRGSHLAIRAPSETVVPFLSLHPPLSHPLAGPSEPSSLESDPHPSQAQDQGLVTHMQAGSHPSKSPIQPPPKPHQMPISRPSTALPRPPEGGSLTRVGDRLLVAPTTRPPAFPPRPRPLRDRPDPIRHPSTSHPSRCFQSSDLVWFRFHFFFLLPL